MRRLLQIYFIFFFLCGILLFLPLPVHAQVLTCPPTQAGQDSLQLHECIMPSPTPYPTITTAPTPTPSAAPISSGLSSNVPLYKQWDPRWGKQSYGCGGTTLASAGCGVTSLAMVLSYHLKKQILPPETKAIALQKGWRICGVGTAWAAMTGMPKMYGLQSKSISWAEGKKYLQQGYPLIQSHGAGYFTGGGHFIVLTGGGGGKYFINDPDGKHRTQATEAQITASLKATWVILK